MRLFLSTVASLMLTAVSITTPSPAKAQAAMPLGSYLKSCRDWQFDGNVIRATCSAGRGSWFATAIEPASCAAGQDIANVEGLLTCTAKPGTYGKYGAVPSGSYRQSCFKPTVAGTVLSVYRCYTGGRANEGATIDLAKCDLTQDIANVNGNLVCAPRKAPPPIRQK